MEFKKLMNNAFYYQDAEGAYYLVSYETIMCKITNKDVIKLSDYKSKTTAKHLNAFFTKLNVNMIAKDFYK